MSSFMYIKELRALAAMAQILNIPADVQRYSSLAANVSQVFNQRFYNAVGSKDGPG